MGHRSLRIRRVLLKMTRNAVTSCLAILILIIILKDPCKVSWKSSAFAFEYLNKCAMNSHKLE